MFNPVMTSELVNGFGGVCYDEALLVAANALCDDDWWDDRYEDEDDTLSAEDYRFFVAQLREVREQYEDATDPEEEARLRDLYSDLHKDLYGVRPRFFDHFLGCVV